MPTSSGGVLGRPQCLQRMLACRMQRHRPSEAVHAPPRTDACNSGVDHRDRMRASSSAAASRLPWRRVQAGSTAQGGQTVADHVGRACRSREVFFYGWLVRFAGNHASRAYPRNSTLGLYFRTSWSDVRQRVLLIKWSVNSLPMTSPRHSTSTCCGGGGPAEQGQSKQSKPGRVCPPLASQQAPADLRHLRRGAAASWPETS